MILRDKQNISAAEFFRRLFCIKRCPQILPAGISVYGL
ncbi:hypothetical protein CUS_7220 [Ruminococcus albus 8]|uniref:Uncharacterized protein n=1 Tax=Ruminococcus albus 8 TaxID=246199 RepID=E9SDM1_RUMAL|nr:hypothetical protein CUS_7220 [Ruminococcus albus 8]